MSRTRLIVTCIFIVVLGLIAAPASWAGSLVATTPASVTASATGNAALLADIDGDGVPDLVVVESGSNQIQVFLGTGTGTFTTPAAATVGVGTSPSAVAAGFLAGGTVPDLVVANAASHDLTVLLNTSTPGTVTLTASSGSPVGVPNTGNSIPQCVAIADLNKDGKQDVVVCDGKADKLVLFKGDGAGGLTTFTTSTISLPAGANPVSVVAVDLDGDANSMPDLASADQGKNEISVTLNGTAPGASDVTFGAVANTATGTGPVQIAAGNILTATVPDLVVANGGATTVTLLKNSGAGVFAAAATHAYSVGGTPTGVIIGDFNADGKPDVVVSASDGADTLFNTGNAQPNTFSTVVNTPVNVGVTPNAIAAADYGSLPNNAPDGRVDIVMPDGGSSKVYGFLSTPFSAVTPVAISPLQEGVAFSNQGVVTFKYDNTPSQTQFNTASAITDYGDGNSSGATVTAPVAGVYTLEANGNTYSDPGAEGSKTISITIVNSTDNETFTTTSPQTVADAPLCSHTNAPLTCVPGTTIGPLNVAPNTPFTGVVATFRDANTTAPISDFTASINWGDGNTTAGSVTQPGGIGTEFSVSGTHTYTSTGTFTIISTVTDVEGGSTQSVVVNTTMNASSIVPTAGAVNVIEGNTLPDGTALATFTGTANDHFTAQVSDWGDGSGVDTHVSITPTPPANTTGPYTIATLGSTHFYAHPGSFSISMKITDTDDGSVSTFTVPATVTDGVIAVTVNDISATTTEGSAASTAIGSFTDQDLHKLPAAYTALIDWGNCGGGAAARPGACGFVAPATVGGAAGSFTVTANAATTFGDATTYTVQIQIKDIDTGLTVSNSQVITVADAALTAPTPVTIQKAGGQPLVENVDLYNGSVGTFHDNAGTFADVTDYDIGSSITWGDGGSDNCSSNAVTTPNCVISSAGSGNMQVNGKHTFTKAGSQLGPPPQVTVTITDKGGQTTLIHDPANVSSVASLQGVANVTDATATRPQEGILFTPNPATGAGSFTSERAGALATDFTATIDWGNGAGPQVATVSGSGPAFLVSGTVTYPDEGGPHALIIHVVDTVDTSTGTTSGATNGSATVIDAPLNTTGLTQPTVPAGVTCNGVPSVVCEGNATGSIPVFTFNDTNPGAPATDFTATINWGDGATSAGVLSQPGGAGTPFVVSGNHTYAEPLGSPYQVSVTVNDVGGSTLTATGVLVTVADAPLSNGTITFPTKPVEGHAFTGQVATFTDGNPTAPLADFPAANVTITWGDEANTITTGTVTQPGGPGTPFVVSGTLPAPGYHDETPPANYTITVRVADVDGATLQWSGSVTVLDAPLNTTALTQPSVPAQVEGTAFASTPVFTFNDTNPVGAAGDFVAAINWGDGVTSPGALSQPGGPGTPFVVSGGHTYGEGGSFQVSVTVNDVGGSALTANGSLIAVGDAPLNTTGLTQPTVGSAVEGASFGPVPVGTFRDTNPLAPLTDYTTAPGGVTINWGDGNTTPGTVSQPGGPGAPFVISGSHAYLNVGNFQVSFTATDREGATVTANGSLIQVTDAPLSGSGVFLTAGNGTLLGVTLGSFTDGNPFAVPGEYTVTINWGDGNTTSGSVTQPGGPGTSFSVIGTHTYNAAQTFFVSIKVVDDDGTILTISSQILIGGAIASDFNTQISPPQVQVAAGQGVDILLTLSPNSQQVAYSNPVNFTGCIVTGPAPSTVKCTFNPATIPDVLQVRQVHMLVDTEGHLAMLGAPQPGRNALAQLAAILPGFVGLAGVVLLGGSRRKRSRTMLWWGATLLLLTVLLLGCGANANIGGGGGGGTVTGQYVIQPTVSDSGPNTPQPCTNGQINGCIPSVTINVF